MSTQTETFNTTYFPEDIVLKGVRECSRDFAYAVHARTQWPIGVLWQYGGIDAHSIPQDIPVHVFCVAPNGQGIDVEGAHAIEDLESLYAEPERNDQTLWFKTFSDLASLAKSIEHNHNASHIDPLFHDISESEKIIKASSAFIALLASLSRPSP